MMREIIIDNIKLFLNLVVELFKLIKFSQFEKQIILIFFIIYGAIANILQIKMKNKNEPKKTNFTFIMFTLVGLFPEIGIPILLVYIIYENFYVQ